MEIANVANYAIAGSVPQDDNTFSASVVGGLALLENIQSGHRFGHSVVSGPSNSGLFRKMIQLFSDEHGFPATMPIKAQLATEKKDLRRTGADRLRAEGARRAPPKRPSLAVRPANGIRRPTHVGAAGLKRGRRRDSQHPSASLHRAAAGRCSCRGGRHSGNERSFRPANLCLPAMRSLE